MAQIVLVSLGVETQSPASGEDVAICPAMVDADYISPSSPFQPYMRISPRFLYFELKFMLRSCSE